MKKIYGLVLALLIGPFTVVLTQAQTAPFSGVWSFEGNDGGSSSNNLIALSSVSYNGVNKLAVNPYTAGFNGLGVNVQNWSTSVCNNTEYVEFAAQPTGTAKLTLTTLTFAFARSTAGPQQLTVRSSVDGFGADIYSRGVSESYQIATIAFSNSGYIERTNPITFRIYACNPTAGGGTLKLDEVQLNGSSLPVTLLSFTAKPEGDRVQLAWATTSERDADRFVVERSADLREYVSVGEVAAKGTTDARQYYGLTDTNPLPGNNYYRLRQIDRDGTAYTFKPVSAVIEASDVVVAVYPNPADPARIHLRLWNANDAIVQLMTMTGQSIDSRVERQSGDADLIPSHPLTAGVYLIEVQIEGRKLVRKVVVR